MSNEEGLPNEVLLWRAVIGQTVRDIYSGTEKEINEVVEWLDTEDFYTCCCLAEIQPEEFLEQMNNLIAMPKALRKKYGFALRQYILLEMN